MIPVEPAVFLHPAQYHDGTIEFVPLVVFIVGVGLIAFGAWRLSEAASADHSDSGGETDPVPER